MRPGYSGLLRLTPRQIERFWLIVRLLELWEEMMDRSVDSTEGLDARAHEGWRAYVLFTQDPGDHLEQFKMPCGCRETTSSRKSGRVTICGPVVYTSTNGTPSQRLSQPGHYYRFVLGKRPWPKDRDGDVTGAEYRPRWFLEGVRYGSLDLQPECPVCGGSGELVGRPESHYIRRAKRSKRAPSIEFEAWSEGEDVVEEDENTHGDDTPGGIDQETWGSGSFAELEHTIAEFERWKLKIDRRDIQIRDPIGILFLEKRMPPEIRVPGKMPGHLRAWAFGKAIVARGNKADPSLIRRRDRFIRKLYQYPTVTQAQLAEMTGMDERHIRNILNGRSDRDAGRIGLYFVWWNYEERRGFWSYLKRQSPNGRTTAVMPKLAGPRLVWSGSSAPFERTWKAVRAEVGSSSVSGRLRTRADS